MAYRSQRARTRTMWWSSLLLAGLLGGCWAVVLAQAATPPAHWPSSSSSSSSYADDYYYGRTMIFGLEPARARALRHRRQMEAMIRRSPLQLRYANETARLLQDRSRVGRSPELGQTATRQLPRELQRVQQRGRANNRTRADSAREQRRRCRNRNCRGRNWCPDMDVGNRAFLAPTVFEGKARSMSSVRNPGSNYAVTFEVKQVYKSQPGFLPLQKNDSVRLHFRDKTVPGKSTLCANGDTVEQQQLQARAPQKERDSAGVVRANIKRGKVYLVFVNRVGPRNFTILGEPVIRSKKNEQAVQAVIRPDYGKFFYIIFQRE